MGGRKHRGGISLIMILRVRAIPSVLKMSLGCFVCACVRAPKGHQDFHLAMFSEPTDTSKNSLGPPPFTSLSKCLYGEGQEPCCLKQ